MLAFACDNELLVTSMSDTNLYICHAGGPKAGELLRVLSVSASRTACLIFFRIVGLEKRMLRAAHFSYKRSLAADRVNGRLHLYVGCVGRPNRLLTSCARQR